MAVVHTHRNRRDQTFQRVGFDNTFFAHPIQRIHQSHTSTSNRSRARTAVSLQHIAVNGNGVLAKRGHVYASTQTTANQTLNFNRTTTLLTTRCLTVHARMGRARQHAVLGRHPTLALAFQKARHTLIHTRRTQNLGVAKLNQYRTFGVAGEIPSNSYRTNLLGCTTTWTHSDILCCAK